MNFFEVTHRVFEFFLYLKDINVYKKGWPTSQKLVNSELLSIKLGKDIIYLKQLLSELYPHSNKSVELSFNNIVFFKGLSLPLDFDIRTYWESQRFNLLLNLSLEEMGVKKVEEYLEVWMINNPPLKGVNYISTMECAIRCINLYAALSILKKENNLTNALLKISYTFFSVNYKLIKNRISLFSSRGNHTLFEYAGLTVCSVLLAPEKSEYWSNKCLCEFDVQTFSDGLGVEQSTAYHLFNVEVSWLIQNYFTKNEKVSSKLNSAIEACSNFWVNGNIVRVGDSDSSVLFSRIFLIDKLVIVKSNSVLNYADSGIVILKNKYLTCYFKYGRLGMPPLFGHGHYDFLSIIVINSDGKYLALDSQTYLYNTTLRTKLRSSKYHSMPSCGQDDVNALTNFSWERQSSGELINSQTDWVHGIYKRGDGITIKRSLKFLDNYLIVIDELYPCKSDKNLNATLLSFSGTNYYHFFEIDIKGNNKPLLPIVSQLPYSKTYSEVERDFISSYTLEVKNDKRILTILSADEIDLPLNEENIKKLVLDLL